MRSISPRYKTDIAFSYSSLRWPLRKRIRPRGGLGGPDSNPCCCWRHPGCRLCAGGPCSGGALCWEHLGALMTHVKGQVGHRAAVRRPRSGREVAAGAAEGQYLHGLADQATTHVSAGQTRSSQPVMSPPTFVGHPLTVAGQAGCVRAFNLPRSQSLLPLNHGS